MTGYGWSWRLCRLEVQLSQLTTPKMNDGESLGWLGNVAPHCLASLEGLLGLGSGSSYIALDYQSLSIQ